MKQLTNVTQGANEGNNHSQVTNITHEYDARLKPKQRKHPILWQIYLTHHELTEMKKRHTLRLKSIQAGKSNMDKDYERWFLEEFKLEENVKPKNKVERKDSIFQMMVDHGQAVGPIWKWCIDKKGMGESLTAKLLALLDDIGKFNTIASLWRHAGYGIYWYWQDEKGKIQCPLDGWNWIELKGGKKYRVWTTTMDLSQWANSGLFIGVPTGNEFAIPQNVNLLPIEKVQFKQPKPDWKLIKHRDVMLKGYHSPYSKPLKALMYNISESFIKQREPFYRDLYDSEKERQYKMHPEPVKVNGTKKYTPLHLDFRARRKVNKVFLKNLWLAWRSFEGLPISDEWEGY